jgi:hypothetical protein
MCSRFNQPTVLDDAAPLRAIPTYAEWKRTLRARTFFIDREPAL